MTHLSWQFLARSLFKRGGEFKKTITVNRKPLKEQLSYKVYVPDYAAVQVVNNQTEAVALIDKLAQRYMGKEKYPLREGEQRITVRIKANYIHASG